VKLRLPTLGLRREAPLLLAAALTLFVVLSGATLMVYRGAVDRFESERVQQALAVAQKLAAETADRAPSRFPELAAELPAGGEAALLDTAGRVVGVVGGPSGVEISPGRFAELAAQAPVSVGPRQGGGQGVIALAPLISGGEHRLLRLVLPAADLAAERRTLAMLTPLVIGSLVVAGIVVALFFRAYSRPYDALLARARAAGTPQTGGDELDVLVQAFDDALAGLSEGERRRARAGLSELVTELGELAAGVAHELRNSVAAMRGWIELARRETLPERAAECLDELDRESLELRRVTEDFLSFARPGSGRPEPLDLVEVTRAAAQDPSLGGAAVEVLGPPSGLHLTADRGLLERALRNLLANAVEAEHAAGRAGAVEARIEPDADGARVVISDRGTGIPAELRARLFTPFVSGRAGGAGLGLALARRIVLLHGGAISLSDREGGGTRVEVRIPSGVSDTKRSES